MNTTVDVNSLSDGCYVKATDYIVELCEDIEKEIGQKLTVKEFQEFLTEAIREINCDIFDDFRNNEITSIQIKTKKLRRKTPKAGDVIAIPMDENKFALAIFIGTTSFGRAFGFFKGLHSANSNYLKQELEPLGVPCYSGFQFLSDGRWKVIGNTPRLLDLFPKEPEIYHYKHDHLDDANIGEYGSVETTDFEVRKLSKKEADRAELSTNEYLSFPLEEQLEDLLKSKLL